MLLFRNAHFDDIGTLRATILIDRHVLEHVLNFF